jgi:hypothetical protein
VLLFLGGFKWYLAAYFKNIPPRAVGRLALSASIAGSGVATAL